VKCSVSSARSSRRCILLTRNDSPENETSFRPDQAISIFVCNLLLNNFQVISDVPCFLIGRWLPSAFADWLPGSVSSSLALKPAEAPVNPNFRSQFWHNTSKVTNV
jgi:hypothetical protein